MEELLIFLVLAGLSWFFDRAKKKEAKKKQQAAKKRPPLEESEGRENTPLPPIQPQWSEADVEVDGGEYVFEETFAEKTEVEVVEEKTEYITIAEKQANVEKENITPLSKAGTRQSKRRLLSENWRRAIVLQAILEKPKALKGDI
jgi:hypothetical protein